MTKLSEQTLETCLVDIAQCIDDNQDPTVLHYQLFNEEPDLALSLIDRLHVMDEKEVDVHGSYYSACLFALDICVAQLQSALEHGSKLAEKFMGQLMAYLATAIEGGTQTLSFWLPVLNGFYDAHVELSVLLQDAYFQLASTEDDFDEAGELSHLDAMRDLILELSALSIFEVTEHFFAQSYAMPADFFTDLVADLASIEEGRDIPPLMLLHPKQEVRDVVVEVLDQLMPHLELTSISLTRLQVIKSWYPANYHGYFDRWIKLQRKKGVVFHRESTV